MNIFFLKRLPNVVFILTLTFFFSSGIFAVDEDPSKLDVRLNTMPKEFKPAAVLTEKPNVPNTRLSSSIGGAVKSAANNVLPPITCYGACQYFGPLIARSYHQEHLWRIHGANICMGVGGAGSFFWQTYQKMLENTPHEAKIQSLQTEVTDLKKSLVTLNQNSQQQTIGIKIIRAIYKDDGIILGELWPPSRLIKPFSINCFSEIQKQCDGKKECEFYVNDQTLIGSQRSEEDKKRIKRLLDITYLCMNGDGHIDYKSEVYSEDSNVLLKCKTGPV